MRHEQWESLVVHARVCLCRYPEPVECAIRADDLVQTVLTDAVDGRFDSAEMTWEKLLPYLKSVIGKRAWKVARGRNRRERRESRGELNPPPSRGEEIAFREASRVWVRRDLARGLRALPKAQRRAVVWKDLQGRTTAEIAALEGVPAATVRQRLARGRAKLGKLLEDYKSWYR